jgi:hypothetical protein
MNEPRVTGRSARLTELTRDWDGDTHDLVEVAEEVASDRDACDRLFSSKQEAFLAGLSVAAECQTRLDASGP